MDTRPSTPPDALSCAAFEERLPAWLEGQLDDAERLAMERHHADCAVCAALVSDLDGLVQSAGALPLLTPSRDLWSDIEARLSAPVIPLGAHRDDREARTLSQMTASQTTPSRRSTSHVRWFAAAAAVLVAVSSGITWTVARARFAPSPVASAPSVASASPTGSAPVSSPAAAVQTGDAPSVATQPAPTPAAAATSTRLSPANRRGVQMQAASMADVDAIYEREIAALRQIVNRRFASLDTGTVRVLRQNLRTIDQAILDSRRALERDPNSGLLSSELDRTLEAKLALMRRVALL